VVIFFPQTVTAFLDKPINVDLSTIQLEAPTENYDDGKDEQQKIKDLNNSLDAEPKKSSP